MPGSEKSILEETLFRKSVIGMLFINCGAYNFKRKKERLMCN